MNRQCQTAAIIYSNGLESLKARTDERFEVKDGNSRSPSTDDEQQRTRRSNSMREDSLPRILPQRKLIGNRVSLLTDRNGALPVTVLVVRQRRLDTDNLNICRDTQPSHDDLHHLRQTDCPVF